MVSQSQKDIFSEERVIWTQNLNPSHSGGIYQLSRSTHLYCKENLNDKSGGEVLIVQYGNYFYINEWFILVQKVLDVQERSFELLVSDLKKVQLMNEDFNKIQLGEYDFLNQYSFKLLESNKDQLILNINHLIPESPFGNLYLGEVGQYWFKNILQYNVKVTESLYQYKGLSDFTQINHLSGVFIVNVFNEEKAKEFQHLFSFFSLDIEENLEDLNEFQTEMQKNIQDPILFRKQKLQELNYFKETKITFNNGYTWNHIPIPNELKDKKQYCDKCSLHLHSFSSNYGQVYSSINSAAIILATGNIGNFLSEKPEDVNTYLSNDAGVTWKEILKGPMMYQILDKGGIIVFIPQEKTKIIYYTLDEGQTIEQIQINHEQGVFIQNVGTDPNQQSTKLILTGFEEIFLDQKLKSIYKIFQIDFSQIFNKKCINSGIENNDSDYYLWTFKDQNQNDCVLGTKNQIIRKKLQSKCQNSNNYQIITQQTQCLCQDSDYECDEGYFQEGKDCKKFEIGPEDTINSDRNSLYLNSNQEEEYCYNYEYQQTGYIKIIGTKCIKGVEKGPIIKDCSKLSNLIIFFKRILKEWKYYFSIIGIMYLVYKITRKVYIKFQDKIKKTKKQQEIIQRKKQQYQNFDFEKTNLYEVNDNDIDNL